MRNTRFLCRRISIWIILVLQIVLITSYFLLQNESGHNLKSNITFNTSLGEVAIRNKLTYHTFGNRITLASIESSRLYVDLNTSLCYKHGSDLEVMGRSKNVVWKCKCLSGWHGNDCSQPEVIWRALLAHRKSVQLKGPRKYLRRIIYLLEVDEFAETSTEIRVNDLNSTVDLFVLYENQRSNYFARKISKFLKEFHSKILYLRLTNVKDVWKIVKSSLTNLQDDDIILVSGPSDYPNGAALQYIKLYDKWPQPFRFRLRWSVYGFFWQHPSKTALKGGACTISYLYETLQENVTLLYNKTADGMILGDLNHFGGWFCEYCYDSLQIIKFLNANPSLSMISFNSANLKKIDNEYVEDLIENGIYLDGKTELLRTRRYRESYFAPIFVTNSSWKYDWLLINLYSKMDYY
uniref:Beta-1,4-mannosyl-glycoprotein 4-beta-N-acetylglucosaminyltransferase n=1 Tax=Photinus pyralis TaxID=7054 RepID=A0A1Y1MTM6_PHOPY